MEKSMTRFAAILLAALAACSSNRNVAAKGGEDVEGNAGIAIHPDIMDEVVVTKRAVTRTEDGRMQVQLMLGSNMRNEISLIVRTDWMDEHGIVVGQSDARPILLVGGGTQLYQASAIDPRAVKYAVSIRPSNIKRKE